MSDLSFLGGCACMVEVESSWSRIASSVDEPAWVRVGVRVAVRVGVRARVHLRRRASQGQGEGEGEGEGEGDRRDEGGHRGAQVLEEAARDEQDRAWLSRDRRMPGCG